MNNPSPTKRSAHRSRTLALFGLLGFQSLCAVYFLVDVVADIFGWEHFPHEAGHDYIEGAVVAALVFGIAFTALEIRNVLQRHQSMEATLKAASGAFHQLMEDRFEDWSLTPSERDVALLAIKGLAIAEIAGARQTKDGTIKAQFSAIYRKAGVSGRTQLLSLFIDELMGDGLIEPRTASFVPS